MSDRPSNKSKLFTVVVLNCMACGVILFLCRVKVPKNQDMTIAVYLDVKQQQNKQFASPSTS